MPEWRQATAKPSVTKAWLAEKVAEEQRNKQLRNQLVSAFMDFTPVVGNIKAAQETATGRNVVEDRELSPGERAIQGASVAIPGIAGVTKGAALGRLLKDLGRASHFNDLTPAMFKQGMEIAANVMKIPSKLLARVAEVKFNPNIREAGIVQSFGPFPLTWKEGKPYHPKSGVELSNMDLPEVTFNPDTMHRITPRELVGHEFSHVGQAAPDPEHTKAYELMFNLRKYINDEDLYLPGSHEAWAAAPSEKQASLIGEHTSKKTAGLGLKDVLDLTQWTKEGSPYYSSMDESLRQTVDRFDQLYRSGSISKEPVERNSEAIKRFRELLEKAVRP